MSRARDLARLQPNSNGVLPATNINADGRVIPEFYYATRASGGITASQTVTSVTVQITNATNKVMVVGSDLLRTSSGVIRGALFVDGVVVENEFMYLQGTVNTWVTQTGIWTGLNLSVGTHIIHLNADFTNGAGAFDGPTYFQVTVWDGPSA